MSTSPRFYIVTVDAEVYRTDDEAVAQNFASDGESVVIDTQPQTYTFDGDTQPVGPVPSEG
jgi:hypothetical protein